MPSLHANLDAATQALYNLGSSASVVLSSHVTPCSTDLPCVIEPPPPGAVPGLIFLCSAAAAALCGLEPAGATVRGEGTGRGATDKQ